MMESIEKLREFIDDQFVCSGQAYLQGMAIAGSIEREITERYMLLPVDADGVPIRVGDVMCSAGIREKGHKVIVSAIFEDGFVEYGSDNGLIGQLCQEDWVHAKPRTIEDVLTDFANEVVHQSLHQSHQIGLTGHELTKRYADEIRELMEVDT